MIQKAADSVLSRPQIEGNIDPKANCTQPNKAKSDSVIHGPG